MEPNKNRGNEKIIKMTHEGEIMMEKVDDGVHMHQYLCSSFAKQQVEALTMIIDAKLHSARKQATGKSRFTGEKKLNVYVAIKKCEYKHLARIL